MSDSCEVLVLGGGPAGATTAWLLARAGWDVVLVERRPFPRAKVCGEYLSGTNRPLFAALDLLSAFDELAGPEITHVALFSGDDEIVAKLPQLKAGWGRALGRDRLDALLLDRAKNAAAVIIQPDAALSLERQGTRWRCRLQSGTEVVAPIVVAAHGSWDGGRLPTQPKRRHSRDSDLFGFKAHFNSSQLPDDMMPLLSFPGGYGGMVHSHDGLVSISCCVRRDQLARLRADGGDAGAAVEAHLRASCLGVHRALDSAVLIGRWLAAGPIRPGMRLHWPAGIFAVGNAAGEAHPVVAEGISMAMQSAWILAKRLDAWRRDDGRTATLPLVAGCYARAWRRAFGPRLAAAEAVARWAMNPALVRATLPVIRRFPAILTWGALASGKNSPVVQSTFTAGHAS